MVTGRFAPTPSGTLHFGSLLAALASFLDARHHQGRWLVRIENIDALREVPGSASAILEALEKHGLYWDGPVLYQSQHLPRYQSQLDSLIQSHQAYPCYCSRKELKGRNALKHYDRFCIKNNLSNKSLKHSIRAVYEQKITHFYDQIQGCYSTEHCPLSDFVVKRSDGFFAYALAVVSDDYFQGITQVVRGADLICDTFLQLQLMQYFGYPPPAFMHIPIAINANGQKLSKQNLAPPLDLRNPQANIVQALSFLQQPTPQPGEFDHLDDLLNWAIQQWDRQRIPKQLSIPYTA